MPPTRLYAFGSNGAGQLGLPHQDDCSTPREVTLPHTTSESDQRIKKISGGGSHTLLLLGSGLCLVAGTRSQGQGGFTGTTESGKVREDLILGFRPIAGQPKLKTCSALWDASILVSEDDEVFVTGAGLKGELGLGPEVTQVFTLRKIPNFPPTNRKIQSIASGVAHTVVLLDNGEAWGWGNGRKGQLGEPADIVRSPRRVVAPKQQINAFRIACGREFSYFLNASAGGVDLVLGSDKWNVVSAAPKRIVSQEPESCGRMIRIVDACWNGVVALRNNGTVEAWGRNDRGQLTPRQEGDVLEIAAGSEHLIASTQDNELLCCGWGEHGNCGPKTDKEGNVARWAAIPVDVPAGSHNFGVAAGCATSFFWVDT